MKHIVILEEHCHISKTVIFLLLLLLKALQLQRSFGLLNEFFPFGSVSDAVPPVCYFHICCITFYIMTLHVPMYRLSVLVRDTCRGLHPWINPKFSFRWDFLAMFFMKLVCWPCAQPPPLWRTWDFLSGKSLLAGMSRLSRREPAFRPCMA